MSATAGRGFRSLTPGMSATLIATKNVRGRRSENGWKWSHDLRPCNQPRLILSSASSLLFEKPARQINPLPVRRLTVLPARMGTGELVALPLKSALELTRAPARNCPVELMPQFIATRHSTSGAGLIWSIGADRQRQPVGSLECWTQPVGAPRTGGSQRLSPSSINFHHHDCQQVEPEVNRDPSITSIRQALASALGQPTYAVDVRAMEVPA